MLGMAILVPLILQEPLPAISGESFGPAVSGKLDSTPRPDVFPDAPRNVQPDIRQSVRPEALPQDVPTGEERGEQAGAMPPLPPREAMTMSVEATHPVSGQTEASSVPAEKSTAKNAAPGAVYTPEALRPLSLFPLLRRRIPVRAPGRLPSVPIRKREVRRQRKPPELKKIQEERSGKRTFRNANQARPDKMLPGGMLLGSGREPS